VIDVVGIQTGLYRSLEQGRVRFRCAVVCSTLLFCLPCNTRPPMLFLGAVFHLGSHRLSWGASSAPSGGLTPLLVCVPPAGTLVQSLSPPRGRVLPVEFRRLGGRLLTARRR
jgi:hypothetical protein